MKFNEVPLERGLKMVPTHYQCQSKTGRNLGIGIANFHIFGEGGKKGVFQVPKFVAESKTA